MKRQLLYALLIACIFSMHSASSTLIGSLESLQQGLQKLNGALTKTPYNPPYTPPLNPPPYTGATKQKNVVVLAPKNATNTVLGFKEYFEKLFPQLGSKNLLPPDFPKINYSFITKDATYVDEADVVLFVTYQVGTRGRKKIIPDIVHSLEQNGIDTPNKKIIIIKIIQGNELDEGKLYENEYDTTDYAKKNIYIVSFAYNGTIGTRHIDENALKNAPDYYRQLADLVQIIQGQKNYSGIYKGKGQVNNYKPGQKQSKPTQQIKEIQYFSTISQETLIGKAEKDLLTELKKRTGISLKPIKYQRLDSDHPFNIMTKAPIGIYIEYLSGRFMGNDTLSEMKADFFNNIDNFIYIYLREDASGDRPTIEIPDKGIYAYPILLQRVEGKLIPTPEVVNSFKKIEATINDLLKK